MQTNHSTYYNTNRRISGVFFQILLVWLTVCLPVVSESIQYLQKVMQEQGKPAAQDEQGQVPQNNEEKTPSSASLSEEFLHHTDGHTDLTVPAGSVFPDMSQSAYLAFHGELFSPPPNFRS